MKIPRWKKWFSYLTPVTIEQVSSDHNPELHVILDKGRLQLLSGKAIYSWDDLYHNFRVALDRLDLGKRKIEDVLLLGLGLGSIPFIIEKIHGKKYRYLAVEVDAEVAELALKYTLPRLESPVEVMTADAEIYVEVCEDSFDLLIVDIFEDDLTPPQFETREFLEACITLLNPGGLLLFNRLHQSLAEQTATERYYNHTFSRTLSGTSYIDTEGNWILVWQKPADF